MVLPLFSGRGGFTNSAVYQATAPGVPAASPSVQSFYGLNASPGFKTPAPPDPAIPVAPFYQNDWTRDTAVPLAIGVSRSTSASYIGQDGYRYYAGANAARLDYRNGVCQGLLIEAEQRTNNAGGNNNMIANSFTRSNGSFDSGVRGVSLTNNMALLFAPTGLSAFPAYYGGPNAVGTGNVCFSVDVMQGANGPCYPCITWGGADTPQTTIGAVYDIVNGTVGQVVQVNGSAGTATVVYTGVEYLDHGVWRIHVAGNIDPQNSNYWAVGFVKALTGNALDANNNLTSTYVGNETMFFNNIDFTRASNPCASISTSGGAAVTRSGDILSTTDAGLLAADAWIVETGDVLIASGGTATILGVNTVTGLGIASATGAANTADGGAQSTTDTATWSGKNRAGLAWTP